MIRLRKFPRFSNGLSAQATAGALICLAWAGSGCLSTQTQSSLDGTNGQSSPYVEAYVEYPGPHEKWSGPASFILHVTAKDKGSALITVTPSFASDEDRMRLLRRQ